MVWITITQERTEDFTDLGQDDLRSLQQELCGDLGVRWERHAATQGGWATLDLIEAPDADTAAQAAARLTEAYDAPCEVTPVEHHFAMTPAQARDLAPEPIPVIAEADQHEAPRNRSAVAQAGHESFPASDPPSWTPG